MNKSHLEELKKALFEEHEKLVDELKSFAKPDTRMAGDWDANFPQFESPEIMETGSSSNLEQEADEVEEYEVRLAAEHSLESRLLEVNKAIERINSGTYGNCKVCKKEISLERLKANPAADTDMEHSQ